MNNVLRLIDWFLKASEDWPFVPRRGLMGRTRGTREGRRTAHARQPTRTTSPTAHDRQTLRDMAEIPADPAENAPAKDEVATPPEVNTLETELATVSEPSFSYIDDDANASFSVVNKRRRSRRVPNTTITKPERPDDILLYESVSKSNLATEILAEEDQWLCKVCGFKNFVFPTVCAMCLCYKDVDSNNLFVYTINGMKKKCSHTRICLVSRRWPAKQRKWEKQKQNGWRRRESC